MMYNLLNGRSDVLVTGVNSGIGKYLHEKIGGVGLVRGSDLNALKRQSFDVIIHCAFNSTPTRLVDDNNLHQYFSDNVLLTQQLVQIPHGLFVFFSTIDVYPRNEQLHKEEEVILADSTRGIYATTKLLSESVIKAATGRFLILRPSFLLGPYMRKNNILKLVEDASPVISLDPQSKCNVVLYSDILSFITYAGLSEIVGTFNLVSSYNMSVDRIAEIVGKRENTTFGSYQYKSGDVSNQKVARFFPAFRKSSEEVMREFITQRRLIM